MSVTRKYLESLLRCCAGFWAGHGADVRRIALLGLWAGSPGVLRLILDHAPPAAAAPPRGSPSRSSTSSRSSDACAIHLAASVALRDCWFMENGSCARRGAAGQLLAQAMQLKTSLW